MDRFLELLAQAFLKYIEAHPEVIEQIVERVIERVVATLATPPTRPT